MPTVRRSPPLRTGLLLVVDSRFRGNVTGKGGPRRARRARMRSLSNGLSINACANRFGEDLGRQHRQGRILHTRLRRIYTAEVIMRIPFHWFEIRVERYVLSLRP